MVMSSIAELPMPLGIKKTVAFLKGARSMFVLRYGLERLDGYGVLSEFSSYYLWHIVGLLVERGLLTVASASEEWHRPVLTVSGQGRGFIHGAITVDCTFVKELNPAHSMQLSDQEKAIFEALRGLRRQISIEKDVPAFMICHDSTLIDIAKSVPTDEAGLLQIRGIGEKFMESYGSAFLSLIAQHGSGTKPAVSAAA
jgi:ATP-dependent DNA helicase RecQ